MTYTKPQLNGFKAIAVIQNSSMSKNGNQNEPHQVVQTIPAYEADE